MLFQQLFVLPQGGTALHGQVAHVAVDIVMKVYPGKRDFVGQGSGTQRRWIAVGFDLILG